ncbi:MAG: hypothetical protein D6748_10515 [Calditrichaeota bacterium]|nr:MAG: hypothetical protein D6748_10515 [Calditrichota bacterium]
MHFFINFIDNPFFSIWKTLLILGIFFVLFGILVIYVPQILVAIIASILFLIGFILITMSLQIRNEEKRINRIHLL